MQGSYTIRLSATFAKNLEPIFDHISKDSPANAANVVRRIVDELENLKLFPHRTIVAGQPRDAKEPVRSLPIPPYVVYFRVSDTHKVVRVTRLLHGAQTPPRDLG